ncbi:Adenylate cyclase (EC / Guanylate cyclase (EC [Olavius algarvensis Delta 1 endosymbiont]|nr:Adenylate cyclase (EC / Guanylate cyclase (EC [Olavius algarvensis Delta 1 endosymbiont]
MEHLDAYIPFDRRLSISHNTPLPDKTTGTVLFADISGFISLTAALAHELGPQRGAEELNHQLNRVYGALIDEVHRYHGSVIGFNGDAISCWFDQDDGFLGTACAFAMQETMRRFETIPISSTNTVSMHIKVAVVQGSVSRFIVGHPDIQLIDVLAGRLLDRMETAGRQLEKGEIIVGEEIVEQFGDHLKTKEWRTAENGERLAVVQSLEIPVPQKKWPEIPPLAPEEIEPWFLKPVFQRLKQGQGRFLSDLRLVVPVFVSFTGIDYDSDPAANDKLNQIVLWVQKILSHYDGHLIQFSMGDIGSYFMIVFGAPVAHEDDSVRAIEAASELISPPPELHFMREVKIGISRGQVHTGAHGGEARSTYGICGEVVSLSARLMSKAEQGQILATSSVVEMADHAYEFKKLGPAKLKGFADPAVLYAVNEKRSEAISGILGTKIKSPLIGRATEREWLMNALQELENGTTHVALIEGEAGIGKSRLMIELFQHYNPEKIVGLSGSGNAVEVTTAYSAWRTVFTQLFDEEISHSHRLNTSETKGDWESAVDKIMHDEPDQIQLAPLLNVVLPLAIPENDLTIEMTGALRAFNTHNLLVKLLKRAANNKPLLIVIEDAHWLDSASWQLLSRVSQEVTPILLVAVTRPMSRPPLEYSQLLKLPHHKLIQLDKLELEAIEALICAQLGVDDLPSQVSSFVHERASGNPFFSEELAFALRDNGFLQIVEKKVEIKHPGDLQSIEFPDTIQEVITSRIDQLSAPLQLSLKIASIIGRVFDISILQGIHPAEPDKEALADQLATLCEADLMRIETPLPEPTYFFKHIITQEVAYRVDA